MPSNNRIQMEAAARAQQWEAATDWLNSLAMFEMLPALEKLGAVTRGKLVEQALKILSGRGWNGSAQRIRWANEVVAAKALPTFTPADLPGDQVQDARRYLAALPLSGTAVSAEVKAAVLAAVHTGKIQGVTGQLTSAANNGHFNDGQHTIVLSAGMFHTLAALSRSNTLVLMSMMRYNEGPHGKVGEDGVAVCSAMDITVYSGLSINLINGGNVENTVAGVCKVIDNLPPGLFALGLTRPSPYPKGPPMPDKDIFLPMNPGAGWPMYKVGFPLGNPTPQFVNLKAAEAVNAALGRNPRAKMNRMFQDGPDHLHLEVISASSA
ncbi:MAG: hypothetical protein PHE55_13925 [Methylococcaceae bacterium]|nr:hypothetical protein [Methylococcaceae bacterium]